MKKTLIAATVIATLAGNLTACNSENNTSTQGYSQAVQQPNARASFNVTFPSQNEEASAAFIHSEAESIQVQMINIRKVLNLMHQNDEYYFPSYIEEEIEQYLSLNNVDAERLFSFVEDVEYGMKELFDFAVANASELNILSATMTPSSPTANLDNLVTGLYIVKVTQTKNDGTPLSSQAMLANLGSGDNNIVVNMLNARWTFVDENNNASPYEFTLLERTEGDYSIDWNPSTDEKESFWQAFSNDPNAPQDVNLKSIDYLSVSVNPLLKQPSVNCYDYGYYNDYGCYEAADGHSLKPTEFIYNLSDKTNNQDISLPDGEIDIANRIEIGENPIQIYDYRLTGDKNLVAPNIFALSMYVSTDNDFASSLSGGAFIISKTLFDGDKTDNGNGKTTIENNEIDTYIHTYTYTTPEGQSAELTVANGYAFTKMISFENDQQDLTTITPAVTNGQTITGTVIEYISQHGVDSSISELDDDAHLRPEAIASAMAVSLVNRANQATAAAVHPLGQNCVDFNSTYYADRASYAWIDGQWVQGEINRSYSVSYDSDGNPVVKGDDLNGDGTVNYFETGVIWNSAYYNYLYNGSESMDLDGDGTIEEYESMAAIRETESNLVTACTFPVRLKAETLPNLNTFAVDSDGNLVDLSDLTTDTTVTVQ